MPRPSVPIKPACPRCGYDQSGEVASWTDRCTVGGRCSECGTAFEWATLMHPARVDLAWMVEHAKGVAGVVRRTPSMLWLMARPRRFWRSVGFLSRTRPIRLGLWGVFVLAVVHLIPAAVLYWHGVIRPPVGRVMMAYSHGPGIDMRGQIHAGALWRSLTWPLAKVDTNPYRRSGFLDEFLSASVSGFDAPLAFWWMLGFNMFWMLILTCLPVSRRLARLRTGHITRAGVLGLFVTVMTIEVPRLVAFGPWLLQEFAGTRPFEYHDAVTNLILVLMCVWTVLWWRAAAIHGWSLQHAGALTRVTTVAAFLGGIVICLFFDFVGLAWLLSRFI